MIKNNEYISNFKHYSLETSLAEPLSLYHIGWEQCRKGYVFGPCYREFYLIHYVLDGFGKYQVDDKKYRLKPGDSFIIHPFETTTYSADEKYPWTYCYFAFCGEAAKNIIDRLPFREKRMTASIQDDRIYPLIKYSMDRLILATDKVMEGLSVLFQLLSIFAEKTSFIAPTKLDENPYVMQAKHYIDFNYSRRITIQDLAKTLSLDRGYLYKLFMRDCKTSPMQYLNKQRMLHAAHMLRETDLPATEIAQLTGFETYSAFYRAFRIEYGCSVSEYRSNLKIEKDLSI